MSKINMNRTQRRTTAIGLFLAITASCLLLSGQAQADVADISNKTLEQLIEDGVPVVDVRRLDEWQATGVIEGSHLITFFDEKGRYDVPGFLEQLGQVVKPDEPVILICARGVRSDTISRLLDERLGYSGIHNVERGILSWIKSGKPVVAHAP